MVKGYYRWRRRGYGTKVSKAQFNKITRNYMKYKVNVNLTLRTSNTSPYLGFIDNNTNAFTMTQLLAKAGNEFLVLRGYYGLYKITGIGLSFTPTTELGANGELRTTIAPIVSVVQSQETVTYNTLAQSPNVVNLSYTTTSKKYVSLNTDWVASDLVAGTSVKIVSYGQAGGNAGIITWGVKVTLYITFKSPL